MALVPDATAAANVRPPVLMITNPVSNTCSETVSLGIGEKDRHQLQTLSHSTANPKTLFAACLLSDPRRRVWNPPYESRTGDISRVQTRDAGSQIVRTRNQ